MMRTVCITYKDLELTITGYYSPYVSGTWDTPPEHESFEIERVYWEDMNVTPLFNELVSDWSGIEEKCLEELRD